MWVYFNFILLYKFTLSDLSMMREVNLWNRGNANLFVPKSEVLSEEATLSNFWKLRFETAKLMKSLKIGSYAHWFKTVFW